MGKRLLRLLFVFIMCLPATLPAQCDEDNEPKVLLVGDSWAFFMAADFTFNTIFDRWGHSNHTFTTNFVLSENGAQTDDFLEPDRLAAIQTALDETPSIKAVHLSIGGNDYLGDWHVDMNQAELDSMAQGVFDRLETIITFIKDADPDVTIVLSGYTYPNFGEVIEDAAPFQEIHPFYGLWEDMGFPSFAQINNLLNSASQIMEDYAANDPRVVFVNATGILQYTYGQDDPVGVPPGGSYPAGSVPLPIGLPDMPSPKESMRDYGLTRDCFHLSPGGYRDFIDYQTREFYHKFLMDDQYIIASDSSLNGAVSALGNVSGELLLGETDGEEFSTLLTFHTPDIPANATVEGAGIFLRIGNIEGDNPIGGQLDVKVKNGGFGASFSLEAEDYTSPPDAQNAACRFGSNGEERWIRLDLPADLLLGIRPDAPTQFLISAEAGGLVTFTGTNDPKLAPVLNLRLDTPSVGLTDTPDWAADIRLYPNPTGGILHLESQGGTIKKMELVNALGQVMMRHGRMLNALDISHLDDGVYFLRILTEKGMVVKKVLKRG